MTRTITGTWSFPTRILFGPGRLRELADACRSLGMTRPLLVTDRGLAALPMVATAMAGLADGGLAPALFGEVRGNPALGDVEAGMAAYRDHGADGVVALGGGSALDVGKVVAFMIAQTRPIWDFEDVGDWWTRATVEGIAPIVAVATTAGTGSEVGRAGVITNPETHEKKVIFHPRMLPGVTIADPELSVGLPPAMTAATGMDAFVHCFEALCAPGYHPMAEGIAVEGIRLIADALPRAVADGGDIEARADMLSAASMGAVAFQKGLGAVHSVAHPVGALYDTHHGLTNAVILPYVMRLNEAAIGDKAERLGRVLGLATPGLAALLDWVLDLRARLGIPHTLAELGVPDDRADEIGEMASRDPTAGGNPVPVDPASLTRVFRAAREGRL